MLSTFHPLCRCTIVPYFELEEGDTRVARDENGEYIDVPSTMNYAEWKEKVINLEKELSHKGINRKTQINKKKIYSNAYDRKIFSLEESKELTRVIKNECINILEHRNGTMYEDLVFINSKTGKMLKRTDYKEKSKVLPSKKMYKMINNSEDYSIIATHNHPESTMPSGGDIFAAYDRKYKYGLIACHNGDIYKYTVNREINDMIIHIYTKKLEYFYTKEYNNHRNYFKKIEKELGIVLEKL